MRLEMTLNFITTEECALLNAWVYKGVVNKWLDVGAYVPKEHWENEGIKYGLS